MSKVLRVADVHERSHTFISLRNVELTNGMSHMSLNRDTQGITTLD